jgi:hypothetical protein
MSDGQLCAIIGKASAQQEKGKRINDQLPMSNDH